MIVGPGHSQDLEVWNAVRLHPTADIHPTVDLGDGTVVWARVLLQGGVRTGTHCSIGANSEIGRSSVLGDSVRIGYNVFLPAHSRVGSRVFIGPSAVFTDDRHPQVNNPRYRAEPPVIEDDVAVGAGAVILPGVVLGQGCTVGAGAVVTRDVPPYNVVVGNPARALQPVAIEDVLTGQLVSLEGP